MEDSRRSKKSPMTWLLGLWALVVCSGYLAQACDECDLQDAFATILAQSSESSDHHSHISTLDEKENLARAVRKALDSLKRISQSVNFSTLKYRRFDGLGNNLNNPFWGASLHTERRLLPNCYDDSKAVPRYQSAMGGVLPSARDVSMSCFEPDEETRLDSVVSQMYMQFGQFVDHDMVLTELEAAKDCCAEIAEDGTHPDMFKGDSCFPIKVSPGDRFFDKCITARRSVGVTTNGVREQINGVTSFIDASQVYGPAKLLSDELRTFEGGKLKVTESNGLPQLGVFKCRNGSVVPDPTPPPKKPVLQHCPHAGDPRVNVFPGLTIMHTVFHREHNRLAEKLAEVNPHWNDEKLFQEARKINIAINQKITYDEYVPKVIGPDVSKVLGLNDPFVYDEDIDASITNVFGAAAFRFGHSQINGPLQMYKSMAPGLSEIFFKPKVMLQHNDGLLKNIIIHQARKGCSKTDQFFSPEVLDKLFLNVDAPGESFDLPALAVHRCRDHGLPAYLEYVDLVIRFLSKYPETRDLVEQLNLPQCLLDGTYKSYRDIDLFPGALYETPVKDGLVGPTFAYLIGEQFQRLRNGDRFFYETSDQSIGFTPDQLKDIKAKTSLASVFCKNVPKLKYMHPRAMERRIKDNQKILCTEYEDLDFSLWKEPQE